MLRGALLVASVLALGCEAPLPDAETPGAQTFARRCGECHRAYGPGSMTWPMWEYQLGRMKLLFSQLGRPWLTPDEERLVTEYLRTHAQGAS
jgi:hypothetical protein